MDRASVALYGAAYIRNDPCTGFDNSEIDVRSGSPLPCSPLGNCSLSAHILHELTC